MLPSPAPEPAFAAKPARPVHTVHHHDAQSARWALEQEEAARAEAEKKLKARRGYLYLTGRALLGGVFVMAAAAKAVQFEATRGAMVELGLPDSALLLGTAVLIELVGGVMLALGLWTRRIAGTLIAYVVAVGLSLYADMSLGLVLTTLSFSAALLLLTAHGAGAYSLDRAAEKRNAL